MRPYLRASISLLAVGCISTSVHTVDHAVRPARSPDAVAVLPEKPEQLYTVIAVIEATGKSVFDGFDDLRAAVIAEAAALGGDAVILGPPATDTKFILTGTAMIRSDTRRLTGEVIVYGLVQRE